MAMKIPAYIYMEVLNYKEKSLALIPQSDNSFILFDRGSTLQSHIQDERQMLQL